MKTGIKTTIQRIKPGRIFEDGGGRRIMKTQDVLPCGGPEALRRCNPVTGENYGDFVVNAVDCRDGSACCCPPDMEIFFVESESDLRLDYGDWNGLGSNVRHIPYVENDKDETN